jgi:MFS family permease
MMNEDIKTKNIFGITSNVFWLGVVSFFNDFSNEMVKSVMPVILTVTLGLSPAIVGFLDGFADALASVLRIFSGWFSDQIGRRKRIVVFGYSLSVLTRFFLSFISSFWHVFIFRVIDRIGKGVRESPRDALMTESAKPEDLGKSFGFQRALDALGGVVGPIGAVLILPIVSGDYRVLFFIASLIGLFALASFIFVKDVKKPTDIIAQKPRKFSLSIKGFSPEFKRLLCALFIFGLGFMPIALVVLKAQSVGLASSMVIVMYLCYTLPYSIFSVPFGRLSDKFGNRLIIISGFILAIISYIILALGTQLYVLIIGFIILGLYSAMTDGVQRAFGSSLLEPSLLASGHGFLQGAVGISSLIGGTVGGIIWTQFGPIQAFIYGASMMVVGLIFFVFVDAKKASTP